MNAQQRRNVEAVRAERVDGLRDVRPAKADFVDPSAAECEGSDVDEHVGTLCQCLPQLRSYDTLVAEWRHTHIRRRRRRVVDRGSGPFDAAVAGGATETSLHQTDLA